LTATVPQEKLAKVQAILQQLEQPHPLSVENRRQARRVSVQMSLDVIVMGMVNAPPVQIYSRNLSIAGIGFVSRRLFKAQERIVIFLRGKKLAGKLILARVTFGRYASGGYYEMGAEFLESIADRPDARIPNRWFAGLTAKPSPPPPPPAARR
jgi:hypothetical protein